MAIALVTVVVAIVVITVLTHVQVLELHVVLLGLFVQLATKALVLVGHVFDLGVVVRVAWIVRVARIARVARSLAVALPARLALVLLPASRLRLARRSVRLALPHLLVNRVWIEWIDVADLVVDLGVLVGVASALGVTTYILRLARLVLAVWRAVVVARLLVELLHRSVVLERVGNVLGACAITEARAALELLTALGVRIVRLVVLLRRRAKAALRQRRHQHTQHHAHAHQPAVPRRRRRRVRPHKLGVRREALGHRMQRTAVRARRRSARRVHHRIRTQHAVDHAETRRLVAHEPIARRVARRDALQLLRDNEHRRTHAVARGGVRGIRRRDVHVRCLVEPCARRHRQQQQRRRRRGCRAQRRTRRAAPPLRHREQLDLVGRHERQARREALAQRRKARAQRVGLVPKGGQRRKVRSAAKRRHAHVLRRGRDDLVERKARAAKQVRGARDGVARHARRDATHAQCAQPRGDRAHVARRARRARKAAAHRQRHVHRVLDQRDAARKVRHVARRVRRGAQALGVCEHRGVVRIGGVCRESRHVGRIAAVHARRVAVVRKHFGAHKRREAEAPQLAQQLGPCAPLLRREALDQLGVLARREGGRLPRELFGRVEDRRAEGVELAARRGQRAPRAQLAHGARQVGEVRRRVAASAGCGGCAVAGDRRRRHVAAEDTHRHVGTLRHEERRGGLPQLVAELAQRAQQVRVRLLCTLLQRVHVHVLPCRKLDVLGDLLIERRAPRRDVGVDGRRKLRKVRGELPQQAARAAGRRRVRAERVEQRQARAQLPDAALAHKRVEQRRELGMRAAARDCLVQRKEPRRNRALLGSRLVVEQVRPAGELEAPPRDDELRECRRVRAQRRVAAGVRLPVVDSDEQLLDRRERLGDRARDVERRDARRALVQLLQLHLLWHRTQQRVDVRAQACDDRLHARELRGLRVVVKVGPWGRRRAPRGEAGDLVRCGHGVHVRRECASGAQPAHERVAVRRPVPRGLCAAKQGKVQFPDGGRDARRRARLARRVGGLEHVGIHGKERTELFVFGACAAIRVHRGLGSRRLGVRRTLRGPERV